MKIFRPFQFLGASLVFVACSAQASSQRLHCDVTDKNDPAYFYEVTGDLVLYHWPDGKGGSAIFKMWRCDKSKTHPKGETQCAAETSQPDAYTAIKILPDVGLALVSWGNLKLDNHVVTYDPIECRELN